MADPSHLFRQSITWAAITGRDAFGKPTIGVKTAVAARVEPMQKLIRDARGQEYQASHSVFTKAQIGLNCFIWLPGSATTDITTAQRVVQVETYPDANGVEVYRRLWV